MIKARHIPVFVWFFRLYSIRMTHFWFHEVTITGELPDSEKSVLLIANHTSWWDGFIINYLNTKYLQKKIHVMMQEEQLAKRMFLNKTGAFSIKNNNRDMIKSLDYSVNLLKNSRNLLVMFPQGKLHSIHHDEVRFRKGLDYIIRKKPDATLLFATILVDWFSNRKPSLFIYLKKPKMTATESLNSIESAYAAHFHECKSKHKQITV